MDLNISNEHLNIYKKIYELPNNNAEIYNNFKEFWCISRMSFLHSGTVILSNIFDERYKDSITIFKILRYSEAKKPSEDVKQKIAVFNERLKENEIRIRSLMCQRNKFYAHNDKMTPEQLLETAFLTHEDKIELLSLGKRICEYFYAYTLGENEAASLLWDNRSSNKFDIMLNCLKQGIIQEYEGLKYV